MHVSSTPQDPESSPDPRDHLAIKIFGVGSAGGHAVKHLAANPVPGATFDQLAVGIDRIEVVHQALFQTEQVQQILVLHGCVDLLLQRVGYSIDDLQVFHEVCN